MKTASSARTAPDTRPDLEPLRARPMCEVLVIGGGINGIATFRELAINGVDVVLIDRGDLVSGTSAASSRMIHGGLRYLENAEFRLVRESVRERNALLRLAPHCVKPLPTTVPILTTFRGLIGAPLRFIGLRRGRYERGALLIKLGLVIYDTFSRAGGQVPRHRFRGRRSSLADHPALRPDVRWTATYYDAALANPERLAWDVAADGLIAGPAARLGTYLEAVGVEPGDEGRVTVRDTIAGEEFTVQARVVVNATGPWGDRTNAALGSATRHLGGTKGSHIVLDNAALSAACGGHEIFFEFTDGRIVLIYPIGDRVLVGTTDLPHDMAEPIRCTDDEVDYFFHLVGHVFPGIALAREQIVFRFAGVRPLPAQNAETPGEISRDYRIEERVGGTVTWFTLVGGKWTTFRALGESLSDRVLAALGRSRTVSTADRMVGGALGYPRESETRRRWIARFSGLVSSARAATLLDRYGTTAERILDRVWREGDESLLCAPEYSRTEIDYLSREEGVIRLVDVVLRRTAIGFRGEVVPGLLEELAEIVGDALGWSPSRRAAEVQHALGVLRDEHAVVVETAAVPQSS